MIGAAHRPAATPGSDAAIVAFDLDGTLADTAPDIVRAINAVLVDHGLAPIQASEARDLINLGAGARKLIENAFRVAGRKIDAATTESMVRGYLDRYLEHIATDSVLFPGCVDALDRLAARGHALLVCTNKPERHARLLLEALGIAERFAVVAGIDTYAYCKPDGRHLTMALEAAGGRAGHAVMVGDSHVDVGAARSAGVPIVCVSFGYTSVPVAELHPDAIIDRFVDLPAAVERIAPRAGASAQAG